MNKVLDELRKLSQEQLETKVKELRHELLDLYVRHEAGQLSNTASLNSKRKLIAKILTIIKEQQVSLGVLNVKKA
jgi:large subunit ribosomal protein L29